MTWRTTVTPVRAALAISLLAPPAPFSISRHEHADPSTIQYKFGRVRLARHAAVLNSLYLFFAGVVRVVGPPALCACGPPCPAFNSSIFPRPQTPSHGPSHAVHHLRSRRWCPHQEGLQGHDAR
ncbi:hypothetical protein EDB85DRAFT_1014711 [Lactarius pseudohatsudake]|nr:hypothetical protein EDB85DRAFT_1014711 [Lactarius pseudohatsudake]